LGNVPLVPLGQELWWGLGLLWTPEERKNLLPLVGIEFQFLGHPAKNLVALLTELFQLHFNYCFFLALIGAIQRLEKN
jgi:hypothetical protein